jgi:orotate phosphoribosyltransferase
LRTPEEFLVSKGVFLTGDFMLKDGSASDYFIDLGRLAYGDDLSCLGTYLEDVISWCNIKTDILIGVPYKSIALASHLSRHTSLPFDFYRKEKKEHGEGGDWVTKALQPGMEALIVDDVLSAGTAKREALQRVIQAGATPVGILVCVDRTEGSLREIDGVPVYALTTASKIKAAKIGC